MADSEHDGASGGATGKVILLVEDNLHNRRIFSGILSHVGFTVREAVNGEQALQMVEQEHPDLVLMDLSLPVLDGWEATRRLKANPELSHIPVLALTAHAMAGDRERALEAGCDGYLAKPISPKKVAAEVQRVLSKLE